MLKYYSKRPKEPEKVAAFDIVFTTYAIMQREGGGEPTDCCHFIDWHRFFLFIFEQKKKFGVVHARKFGSLLHSTTNKSFFFFSFPSLLVQKHAHTHTQKKKTESFWMSHMSSRIETRAKRRASCVCVVLPNGVSQVLNNNNKKKYNEKKTHTTGILLLGLRPKCFLVCCLSLVQKKIKKEHR